MAQVDYFLKADGIPGESTDEKHKGEIDLESFSWGATNNTTIGSATGGAGAGKVKQNSLIITKRYDKSSPVLFSTLASGTHLKEAKLTARKAGGTQVDYVILTMTTVFLTKYDILGAVQDNGVVREHIELVFGKLEVEYKEQKSDGSLGGTVKQGWDFIANKKV